MTAPTPPRWTMADLHNMARSEADKASALTRAALAMIRAGECPNCIEATLAAADAALDRLEAVNLDIEGRLLTALQRARRRASGKPTRARKTKTASTEDAAIGGTKPEHSAAPTAANVVTFKQRPRAPGKPL